MRIEIADRIMGAFVARKIIVKNVASLFNRLVLPFRFNNGEVAESSCSSIGLATSQGVPYVENPEFGSRNLQVKLARVAAGGDFEWPDVAALNKTVAELATPYHRIVELGGGTGLFAYTRGLSGDCEIVCSELDAEAGAWAKANRGLPNITYTTEIRPEILGTFQLLVSIEVIEHVSDFRSFLQTCAALAPTAIITTPNKARTKKHLTAGPPEYEQHVREWTAGEFYWLLKCYYRTVELQAMPKPEEVGSVPITVTDTMSPVIAICSAPY